MIAYPKSRQTDHTDILHGVPIPDPYRWLEDIDSEETHRWIEEENKVTQAFLDRIPARESIRRRVTQLWDYEKYSAPTKKGEHYFYYRNDGLQNQSVLYRICGLEGKPEVVLDPNTFSADGTVALSETSITRDGRLMAYAVSESGSDWQTVKVRDLETGKDRDDLLKWVKFSGLSWDKAFAGFYYSRYPEATSGMNLKSANFHQKLYYHRLGAPQTEDKLVFELPDHPKWSVNGSVTEDGRYLIIYVSPDGKLANALYYMDLGSADGTVVKLLDRFDARYSLFGNVGPVFYCWTDLTAPRGRAFALDVRNPESGKWREIIPQSDDILDGMSILDNDKIIAQYMHDAHSRVRVFDLQGQHLRDVPMPGLGSAGGFGGYQDEKETFYTFTGFTDPATIYRYDVQTGESTLFRRPEVDFNPDLFETRQVFYKSKDGTRVPLFICHKKGLRLDGSNPTYLYGYGGFGAAMQPGFSITRVVWMEQGGVYAQACIRGGGEYGKEWHEAGTKLRKQNVFDDFIAAAEYLIANRYTRPEKLAIAGGSNGGLLVGACMNQRPDLFACCLPAVGVMDMLRFHKFTIGWAWTTDYGSPDDPEEFKALLAYSPYHNVRPGTHYPATFITTADHDDRVFPAHSFKYAAALQAAQGCPKPTLIQIETKAGHGAGKPTTKIIQNIADEYGFVFWALGMEWRDAAAPR